MVASSTPIFFKVKYAKSFVSEVIAKIVTASEPWHLNVKGRCEVTFFCKVLPLSSIDRYGRMHCGTSRYFGGLMCCPKVASFVF